ncbi:MAG: PIN domain-containing protein [Thermomicrobiales bacterium]
MPTYLLAEKNLHISRDAVLIDTNVLVAAFSPKEPTSRKDYAKYVLEEEYSLVLIPSVVVVEAWGLIVGRDNARSAGIKMLTWLHETSRVLIVPSHQSSIELVQQVADAFFVDCVDAILAEFATEITNLCGLKPWIPIVTYDSGDFTKMFLQPDLRFSIFDMNTLEPINRS